MEHYVPGTVLRTLLLMWHDVLIKMLEAIVFYSIKHLKAPSLGDFK